MAQRALGEDRVVELSDGLERRGARPLRAPRRHHHADLHPGLRRRALARGDLRRPRRRATSRSTDAERHTMWTLGKTAALAASARIATAPAGARAAARRAHRPGARASTSGSCSGCSASRWCWAPDRARRRGARSLPRRDPARRSATCATRSRARSRHSPQTTGATLAEELRAAAAATTAACRSRSTGSSARRCRGQLEPLAQSVLAEALRNADKHAGRRRVEVGVGRHDGDVRARGPQRRRRGDAPARRRRGHGPAAGRVRGAPARRRVEFGARRATSGGCAWSLPVRMRRRATTLRVLVVDDHDVVHWGFRLLLDRAALGRALPDRPRRPRRRSTSPRATSRTSRWSTCSSASESGAELCEASCASRPHTRVLLISGAGRISPAGRQGRRAPPGSSPRTGRRTTSRRRCAMVAQGDDGVRPALRRAVGAAQRPRARGARR